MAAASRFKGSGRLSSKVGLPSIRPGPRRGAPYFPETPFPGVIGNSPISDWPTTRVSHIEYVKFGNLRFQVLRERKRRVFHVPD